MVSLAQKEKKQSKSYSDEFENYLTKQRLKTTFNGIEVSPFSWYKKKLGLSN